MNLIYFLANNPCEDPEILKIIYYIRFLLTAAFTVIPMILIIMITVDFIKSVSAGTEDVMRKNQKIVIKRVIYCVLVFLVMPIVNITFSTFKTSGQDSLISDGGVNYLSCWANADDVDSINALTINASFETDGGKVYGSSSRLCNESGVCKIVQSCGGNSECEIVLPKASKNGYALKGWIKNSGSEALQPGQKITITASDKFTALWVETQKEDNGISNEDITNSDNKPKPNPDENKDDDNKLPSNDGNPPSKDDGNTTSTPTAPVTLASDIETRITQMVTYAKEFKGYSLSEFNSVVGGGYSGDWCSWFVYKIYEKFEFTYDIDFDSDAISYACGWLELEDGAYNGYYRGVKTGNLNYTPQPGDLIIFTEDSWCATHVGMVTAVDNNYIYTVEGNTAGSGNNWAATSKVSLYEYSFPNEGGKYIGDGDSGIAGYYSLRQLISMNK